MAPSGFCFPNPGQRFPSQNSTQSRANSCAKPRSACPRRTPLFAVALLVAFTVPPLPPVLPAEPAYAPHSKPNSNTIRGVAGSSMHDNQLMHVRAASKAHECDFHATAQACKAPCPACGRRLWPAPALPRRPATRPRAPPPSLPQRSKSSWYAPRTSDCCLAYRLAACFWPVFPSSMRPSCCLDCFRRCWPFRGSDAARRSVCVLASSQRWLQPRGAPRAEPRMTSRKGAACSQRARSVSWRDAFVDEAYYRAKLEARPTPRRLRSSAFCSWRRLRLGWRLASAATPRRRPLVALAAWVRSALAPPQRERESPLQARRNSIHHDCWHSRVTWVVQIAALIGAPEIGAERGAVHAPQCGGCSRMCGAS